MAYEFHYTPTGTGVISGKEVLEQTEDAINDLGNTAISGVQEALDKAEQALTNSANAVDDAQTALNTANNAEGVAIQAQTDVSNLSGTVTNIGNRVTTAEGNISNLQGRMTTAEGNVTNLQGRMTTAETNIGNLQTAVSTAQATANSAQQTATTARQQSYVFRYSSTALTPSSTNSNTLLDNTDNLKVGDKVIDSSGVLFSVTAIDTQNSTFTIGTALIDLAQDSDVVHKSGNETISGDKTFSGNNSFIKTINSSYPIVFSSQYANVQLGEMPPSDVSLSRFDCNDKNKDPLCYFRQLYQSSGTSTFQIFVRNKFASGTLSPSGTYDYAYFGIGIEPDKSPFAVLKGTFKPSTTNNYDLGTSTNKWKTFNGLTPSSLSLPSDRSARVDISGYFTNMASGDTNTYTAPSNGWIYLSLDDVTEVNLESQTSGGLTNYGDYRSRSSNGSLLCLFPVRKDDVFVSQWYTTTTVTVTNAYFIPCLGNI